MLFFLKSFIFILSVPRGLDKDSVVTPCVNFLFTAVTNVHKLTQCLKTYKLIILQYCRFEVLWGLTESSRSQDCIPFWRLYGRIRFLDFSNSRGFFLQSFRQQYCIFLCPSPIVTFPLILLLGFHLPLLRALVIRFGPPG